MTTSADGISRHSTAGDSTLHASCSSPSDSNDNYIVNPSEHSSPITPTRPAHQLPTDTRNGIESMPDNQTDCTNNDTHDNGSTSYPHDHLNTPTFQISGHQRTRSRPNSTGLQLDTNLPPTPSGTGNLSPLANRLSVQDITSQYQMTDKNSLTPILNQYWPPRAYDPNNAYSPISISAMPSPALSAMIDITPLPSPIGEYPRRISNPMILSRSGSMRSSQGSGPSRQNSVDIAPRKKKAYGSLLPAAVEGQIVNAQGAAGHGRNRSVSDFIPEALYNIRHRVATFGPEDLSAVDHKNIRAKHEGPSMQREEHLAGQRGLTQQNEASQTLPSPPPSNKSVTESEVDGEDILLLSEEAGVEYFNIRSGSQSRKRKWRSVRQLGQGTFSKVLLATSEHVQPGTIVQEDKLDPSKLVAVKISEHGPKGGADEERIKHGLDREIEILKNISHPSIVHLKALEEVPGRTYLVLTYCTGGDLFELASQQRDLLTPSLVQRIFAELVSATRYLHLQNIVHRDIKLENVLVNLPRPQLSSLDSPQTYPSPIVTLTDLGLSRRINPESPLLTTRCGSEDYAAPELLLGQPYDGRSTDAWALGVLLYALMEGRLPFDAPPGRPDRSKNTHRIARCDWIWSRFGDEDGEWDPSAAAKGAEEGAWDGAKSVVEAFLKKVRMGRKSLEEIETWDWVKAGVCVDGGLTRREDDGTLLTQS